MVVISYPDRHPFGGIRSRSRFLAVATAGFAAALILLPSAGAQTAPRLISVTPSDGATDVPVTTSIVFEFDQAMDTGVSLVPSIEFFGTVFVGNIKLSAGAENPFPGSSWSADGHTLTAKFFVGEWPTGTLIDWTLNPSGGGEEPLVNEEGNPLATVSGSFTTAGKPTGGGGGDEDCDGLPDGWGFYGIFKGASYEQTSAADPVPAKEYAFTFGALARSQTNGPALLEGSVTFPSGDAQVLSGRFGNFVFLSTPPTESLLDSLFQAGGYTLRFTQTGQPERVIPMDLPANNVPIPKLANFVDAQTLPAGQDFALRWNSFNTAGPNDSISLRVETGLTSETLFSAPDLCVPRELPVTATSVVIPAHTLQPDQVYQATLTFTKVFYRSTNTVAEMAGSGSLQRETMFTLNTGTGGTGPVDAAKLSAVLQPSTGDPQVQLTGSATKSYRIERSSTLSSPVWLNLGSVTMDGAGRGVFDDTGVGQVFPVFYRAVAN